MNQNFSSVLAQVSSNFTYVPEMVERGLTNVFHMYMHPCVPIKVDSQVSY